MAEKSSVASKIFVGLFLVVIFPTLALFLQTHLIGTPVPGPKPEDLPTITVEELNEHPQAYDGKTFCLLTQVSGTVFTENDFFRLTIKGSRTMVECKTLHKVGINFKIPRQRKIALMDSWKPDFFYPVKLTVKVSKGPSGAWNAIVLDMEKADNVPFQKLTEKNLPPDLSENLTGTWSGTWENSNALGGKASLVLTEKADGTLVGSLENDYRIQKGRRVSRDEVTWECSLKDETFQVRGKIRDRGRSLLLLYSGTVTTGNMTKTFMGMYLLNRDRADPYSAPATTGLPGRWKGRWGNSDGYIGEAEVVLTEKLDGTLKGVWDDGTTVNVVKVNDLLAKWEYQVDDKEKKCEVHLDGDLLRMNYKVTFSPKGNRNDYSGVIWLYRD